VRVSCRRRYEWRRACRPVDAETRPRGPAAFARQCSLHDDVRALLHGRHGAVVGRRGRVAVALGGHERCELPALPAQIFQIGRLMREPAVRELRAPGPASGAAVRPSAAARSSSVRWRQLDIRQVRSGQAQASVDSLHGSLTHAGADAYVAKTVRRTPSAAWRCPISSSA
jgi:hypothetical protein